MANYYEYCTHECSDVESVGVGSGDTGSGLYSDKPLGEERVCIALGLKKIEWPEGQEPEGYDWISLTPEVATLLADLLAPYRTR